MKYLIGIVGAACLYALGTTGAHAAGAQPATEAHARPAVWMRIEFPSGTTRMAITYDRKLVAAIQGPPGASDKNLGWGFRPIIQKDGTVNVKIYRLRGGTKLVSSEIGKQNLRYIETLAPRPAATTTQPSDRHIRIKIMGTGSVTQLKAEMREFQHIARWQP